MPLLITNEKYNGGNSLLANVGTWVNGEVEFSTRFAVGSGASNKIYYHSFGGNYYLTIQAGTFADVGFLAGDTIILTYKMLGYPSAFQDQTFTCTVLYISGSDMFIDIPFTINNNPPWIIGTPEHFNGTQFPTDNYVNGLLIVASKAPASIQFKFNLTPNGSSTLNSVIDGNENTFEIQDTSLMAIATPENMTQLTYYSGGLIKNVQLELISVSPDQWRKYRVTYKFIQWGFLQSGNSIPSYFQGVSHLAPLPSISCFAEYNNPNGMLQKNGLNVEASTGFFDENFNGGLNTYTPVSIQWKDSLGNNISKLDYSGASTFEAIINGNVQDSVNSRYQIGLVWRPEDTSTYQDVPSNNLGENLLLNAPEVNFIGDGSVDATLYQGLQNSTGAKWDLSDISFTVLTPTQVKVTGKVTPNSQLTSLMASYPDGERLTTLWIGISDFNLLGQYSNHVALRIFDEDNYDAPTLGVQIPDVISEILLDHNGNDITDNTVQNTTTEDDVLYKSEFLLIDNVDYDGVRARVFAYNTVSGDEFTLENIFFDFSSVVNIAGQFQPNFTVNRGFNLPPLSDRNHVSLKRKPSLDVAGKYGVELHYGFLNDWRYWIGQLNVDNDFFDITEPNDGKNKDWQRFSDNGNWIIRIAYYTSVGGVDDFNYYKTRIRPYEDDINVSTSWGLTVISDGTTPTNLVADELHEVKATLTWTSGVYTSPWAEVTIEDFEGGNRWVLSSILEHGGISSNPLIPIIGMTKLQLNLISSNIAELKFNVDSSLLSSNDVCMSARIYSEDTSPPAGYIVMTSNDAELAYSVRRISHPTVYPLGSPCIRVRRSIDNAEQDFGFIGGVGANKNDLDTVAIQVFVGDGGGNHGYVTTWYDQSGNGNNAIQSNITKQARIVKSGVIDTGTNGKPSLVFNGTTDFYNYNPINTTEQFLDASVIDRGVNEIVNTLGNNNQPNPYSMAIDFSNNLSTGIVYTGNIGLGTSVLTGGINIGTYRTAFGITLSVLNGVNSSIVNSTNVVTTKLNTIGFFPAIGGDFYNKSKLQEIIYYAKDNAPGYNDIDTNQINYYANY